MLAAHRLELASVSSPVEYVVEEPGAVSHSVFHAYPHFAGMHDNFRIARAAAMRIVE